MQGSLAKNIALTLGLSSAICTQLTYAEGDNTIDGDPLLTTLSVQGGESQLITVLDIGSGVGLFEGDVLVPLASGISNRSAGVQAQSFSTALEGSLWPDGVLPYKFDAFLTSTARAKILDAIDHWNSLTPIRIEPHSGQADYVNFVNESGCASYIGRIGGEQEIYSSAGCSMGNFVHEIGHALGLYHEHTRPDRDSYVTVHWDNIQSNRSHNFDIVSDNIQLNTAYDYGSIMHYGKTFFAIDANENTITPADSNANIGQRIALSNDDITGIKALYSTGFQVDLGLTPRRPMPSSALVARIVINNTTGGSVNSTSIEATLPVDVIFQQISGSGWSCTSLGQDLSCTGPTLQSGATSSPTITMQAPIAVSNLNFSFNTSGSNGSGLEFSTDAIRTLTMTAVNDPPEVEIGQELVAIVPITSVELPVDKVLADDANGHPLSNYSLVTQSHPGVFEIDVNTGDIFATSVDALNALEGQTAQLLVTVFDGFEQASDTSVEIQVLTSAGLTEQGSTTNSGSGGGTFTAFWLLILLPLRRIHLRAATTRALSTRA